MDRPGIQVVVRNRMQVRRLFTYVLLFWPMALVPFSSAADVLVMHSGERFSASRLWEEGNTIRFDMNGLIVRVDKSEVAHIIRSDTPAVNAGILPDQPINDNSLTPSKTRINASPKTDGITRQPPKPIPNKTIIQVDNDGISQQKYETEVLHTATAPQSLTEQAPAPDPSSAADQLQKAAALPNPVAAGPQETEVSGTGLPGVAWYMQPAELPGIVRTSTEDLYGGVEQYHYPDSDPRFGGARLDGLLFGFWRNRLYTISCWIDGRPGYERLKAEVFKNYGTGRKNRAGLERFTWQNQASDRLLEFDDRLNTGIFWMRSRVLDRFIKKANLQ